MAYIKFCSRWKTQAIPTFLPDTFNADEMELIECTINVSLLELITMFFAAVALGTDVGIIVLGLYNLNKNDIPRV